jgi:hypothetical protein
VKRLALIIACAGGGAGGGACGGSSAVDTSQSAPIEPAKDAIAKQVENGPVKVVEKVWPAKPNLDEPIYVRLVIDAQPGVTVTAPFEEAGDGRIGRFLVPKFDHHSSRGADGSYHEEQTYTLEAPSSGKQRIPPLRFEMLDARRLGSAAGGGDGKTQELLTDEIPLDIAPVKTEAIGAKLHDPTGHIDPDVGGMPWLEILLVLSAAAVLGSGGILLLRLAAARRKVAARRSAYDEAVAMLRGLEERGAPSAEQADAWFVELSAIVRGYLERRYEIRAPELTTEEFLAEASRGKELTVEHRGLLSAFLERCDRVKFAGYRPDPDESMASLNAARAFVEDTRVREPTEAAA